MPRLYVYGLCALSLGVGYYTVYHRIYIARYQMERLTERSLEIRKMEGKELVQQFARLEMYLNNPLLMSVDTTSLVQGNDTHNGDSIYGWTNKDNTINTDKTEVSPVLQIVNSLTADQHKIIPATTTVAPSVNNNFEPHNSPSEQISSDNYYRQSRIRRGNNNNNNKNNSQSWLVTNYEKLMFYCKLQQFRKRIADSGYTSLTAQMKANMLTEVQHMEEQHCNELNFRDTALLFTEKLKCAFAYCIYLFCFRVLPFTLLWRDSSWRRWCLHLTSVYIVNLLEVDCVLLFDEKSQLYSGCNLSNKHVNDDGEEQYYRLIMHCDHWIEEVGFWACNNNPLLQCQINSKTINSDKAYDKANATSMENNVNNDNNNSTSSQSYVCNRCKLILAINSHTRRKDKRHNPFAADYHSYCNMLTWSREIEREEALEKLKERFTAERVGDEREKQQTYMQNNELSSHQHNVTSKNVHDGNALVEYIYNDEKKRESANYITERQAQLWCYPAAIDLSYVEESNNNNKSETISNNKEILSMETNDEEAHIHSTLHNNKSNLLNSSEIVKFNDDAPCYVPVSVAGLPRMWFIDEAHSREDIFTAKSREEILESVYGKQCIKDVKTSNSHTHGVNDNTLIKSDASNEINVATNDEYYKLLSPYTVPWYSPMWWAGVYGGRTRSGRKTRRLLCYVVGKSCYASEFVDALVNTQQLAIQCAYM